MQKIIVNESICSVDVILMEKIFSQEVFCRQKFSVFCQIPVKSFLFLQYFLSGPQGLILAAKTAATTSVSLPLFLHSDSFIFAKPANRFCAANHLFQSCWRVFILDVSFFFQRIQASSGKPPRVININFQTAPIIAERRTIKLG